MTPIKAGMKNLGMLDHFTRENFVVLQSEERCPQTAMADLSSVSAFAVEISPWHLHLLPYLMTPPYSLHPLLQIHLHALYPVHLDTQIPLSLLGSLGCCLSDAQYVHIIHLPFVQLIPSSLLPSLLMLVDGCLVPFALTLKPIHLAALYWVCVARFL